VLGNEERRSRRTEIVSRLYNEGWARGDFDLEESIEVGDRLVCVQHATGTGKGSGIESEIRYACMYTFGRNGRITEVNEYATREEALAAVSRAAARSAVRTTR
jgi:ketosteroid isomerase-like protein